jgi:ketosteroid isomerase-like protein
MWGRLPSGGWSRATWTLDGTVSFGVPEYLDAGDDVVVIWHLSGRTPHGGGLPFDQTIAHIWHFEDGKIRRIRQYLSRAEALEAAGLRE